MQDLGVITFAGGRSEIERKTERGRDVERNMANERVSGMERQREESGEMHRAVFAVV